MPQPDDRGTGSAQELVSFAVRAEELGYHSLWTVTPFNIATAGVDPLVALTAVATHTCVVRLGVGVVALPLRAPAELARTAASIDLISGGRLELGVGLGDGPSVDILSVGLEPGVRAARFEDGIAVLRELWSGEVVEFRGKTLSLAGWQGHPMPAQGPHTRLWFGGHSRTALRRTARLADGWIAAGGRPPKLTSADLDYLQQQLRAHGRDTSSFPVAKRVYVALGDSKSRMRSRVRKWSRAQYGNRDHGESVCVLGSAQTIAETLAGYVDMGVSVLILNPVDDYFRQMVSLAQEVVPLV